MASAVSSNSYSKEPNSNDSRVYVALSDLMALQHQAVGYSFLPRQPIHSLLAGRHGSKLRGRGLNFEELRRYRPGDDIRSLDWKVTRRLRKPHVRVYNEERERVLLLVIDQRLPMFFGSQRAMKSVVAAELAALAGWRGLSGGDRVGALIFNDDELVELKPRRSRKQFSRILSVISEFNQRLKVGGKANPGQLNAVMKRASELAGHDQLIALISDLSGADEQTDRYITRLSQHNDVMIGFVYDTLENRLPKGGRLSVSNGDLHLEVDTDNTDLRQRYEQAFDERVNTAREFYQRRSVPILPIDTETDVALQLRLLLNQSGGRGQMVKRLQGREGVARERRE